MSVTSITVSLSCMKRMTASPTCSRYLLMGTSENVHHRRTAEVNALIQRPLALASDRRNGHSRQSITLRLLAFCIVDVSERIKGTYPPTLNLIALSFYT